MNSSAPQGKTWLGRAGVTRWASASQFGAAAGLIGAAGALAWVVARPPAPTNLDSRRGPRELAPVSSEKALVDRAPSAPRAIEAEFPVFNVEPPFEVIDSVTFRSGLNSIRLAGVTG